MGVDFKPDVQPTCTDGIQNGTETGIDCGGGTCPKCGVGMSCRTDADCPPGQACAGFTCRPIPPTCTDGIQNGNETGVDCGGGTCPKCGVGESCRTDADCPPGHACAGFTCRTIPASSCTDGIQNGNETGVDCGGGTCPKCGVGESCRTDADCPPRSSCAGFTCRTIPAPPAPTASRTETRPASIVVAAPARSAVSAKAVAPTPTARPVSRAPAVSCRPVLACVLPAGGVAWWTRRGPLPRLDRNPRWHAVRQRAVRPRRHRQRIRLRRRHAGVRGRRRRARSGRHQRLHHRRLGQHHRRSRPDRRQDPCVRQRRISARPGRRAPAHHRGRRGVGDRGSPADQHLHTRRRRGRCGQGRPVRERRAGDRGAVGRLRRPGQRPSAAHRRRLRRRLPVSGRHRRAAHLQPGADRRRGQQLSLQTTSCP